MKIQKLILCLMMFQLFSAGSCQKEVDEPILPHTTQNGKGTFGCLVNGVIWLPESTIGFPANPRVSAELIREGNTRIWKFGASKGNSSSFHFSIYKESLNEGIINIPIDSKKDIGIYFFSKTYNKPSFTWQRNLPGELIITKLDTINNILSGTFWFDMINAENKKVEIRDGRFDLKINQIQP